MKTRFISVSPLLGLAEEHDVPQIYCIISTAHDSSVNINEGKVLQNFSSDFFTRLITET
jgi:hypothetical protein